MRLIKPSEGEYYHICNRGMHKREIFHNNNDYLRFLFQIIHFQSPKNFTNITQDAKTFGNNLLRNNRPSGSIINEICRGRTIGLIAFAFMPNHFHLIVKEMLDGGIPFYLQRTQNGFTKYSNIKNKASGHVFQGPYRIVHIEDNNQLLHTSAYLHRNCRELPGWKNREAKYPWSSLQDYTDHNRFGNLLLTEPILEQFANPKEYLDFVNSSSAKEFDEEIRAIEL